MELAQLLDVTRNALEDMKASDLLEIDIQGKSSVTDMILIASGTSTRHVKSLADSVVMKAKEAGFEPLGTEGEQEGEWVLVDLNDVIVHIMLPTVREFYKLEKLWEPLLDKGMTLQEKTA